MRTRVFSKSAEGLFAVAVGAVVCAAFVPALASAAPTGAVHTLPTGSVDGGSSDGVRTATVDDEGEQLTLRLHKMNLRGSEFSMAVQDSDGELTDAVIPAPRSYIGSVEGRPDAIVSAIVDSAGTLRGQVIFDRGASLEFVGSDVVGRSTAPIDAKPKWPTAAIAPASAARVGKTVKQFVVGLDLSGEWYSAHGAGSPRRRSGSGRGINGPHRCHLDQRRRDSAGPRSSCPTGRFRR